MQMDVDSFAGNPDERRDHELLNRFIAHRDEDAFRAIVVRHGPRLMQVCRGLLRSEHDAEDACQATFLVLVRNARKIRRRTSLTSWLYGTAYRICLKASARIQKRREKESREMMMDTKDSLDELADRHAHWVLHEELNQLPEKYRAPLVICYLEGKTREEAARELGCGLGVIKGRLERARRQLRRRLLSRGSTFAGLSGLCVISTAAQAAICESFVQSTVDTALAFSRGVTDAGGVGSEVVELAKGDLAVMSTSVSAKYVTAALLAMALFGVCSLLLARTAIAEQPSGGPNVIQVAASPNENEAAAPALKVETDAPKTAGKSTGLKVTLNEKGNVIVLGQEVPLDKLKPILDELAKLREPGTEAPVVVIQAHPKTPHEKVVTLLKLCQQLGSAKIAIAVSPGKKSPKVATPAATTVASVAMVFEGHTGEVNAVAFSPDGRIFASGSTDDTLRLWEAASGKELASMKCDGGGIWTVAYSPDGRFVVCGCNDGTIKAWDVKSKKLLFVSQATKHEVWSVAISPDGKLVAVGTKDAQVQLRDAKTGEQKYSVDNVSQVSGIAFSPNGKLLTTSSVNQPMKVWDVETGKAILTAEKAPSFQQWVDFAPDGKQIATACWNGSVLIWDAETGVLKRTLQHSSRGPFADRLDLGRFGTRPLPPVYFVVYSPDGKLLASAGRDRTAKLWDAETGEAVAVLKPHGNTVTSVAFSLDGRQIVTAAEDNMIRLWNLSANVEQQSPPK